MGCESGSSDAGTRLESPVSSSSSPMPKGGVGGGAAGGSPSLPVELAAGIRSSVRGPTGARRSVRFAGFEASGPVDRTATAGGAGGSGSETGGSGAMRSGRRPVRGSGSAGGVSGSSHEGAEGPDAERKSSAGTSPGVVSSPVRPLCQPVFSRSKTSGSGWPASSRASSSTPSSACLARTRASQSGISPFAADGAGGVGSPAAAGAAGDSSASQLGSSPAGGPASSEEASRRRLSQSGDSAGRPTGRAAGSCSSGSPAGGWAAALPSHSLCDQSGSVERKRASQSPSSAGSTGWAGAGGSSSGPRRRDSQSGIGGSGWSDSGGVAPAGRTGLRRAPQNPHSSAPSGLGLLHIGQRTSATAQSP